MNTIRDYTEAIRTRVCTECLLPSGMGLCGTGSPEECPLNKFLPQAIDAVNLGKSKSILEYFRSLHKREASNGVDDRIISNEEALWFEEFLPLIEVAVGEATSKGWKRVDRFH